MKTIRVSASTAYDVVIEAGALGKLGALAAEACGLCKAAVITDSNVAPLYLSAAESALRGAGFSTAVHVFPAGEESKNIRVWGEILDFLARERLERGDIAVALGGGVCGDLTGFAASAYRRGIRYIQVPTTLLADVDSSVGGKTAIDSPYGKNLIGAFHQPSLVVCDPDALKTLPENVYRDGCAEVIKCAVLGDPALFSALSKTPAIEMAEEVIFSCVNLKRELVEEDEFDTGRRKFLNLGHSFGHAIEAVSGYTVSHGSAVAIGLAMITRAAEKRGFCDKETTESIISLLRRYSLPVASPYPAEALCRAMLSDKKMERGSIQLIVPERIGSCRIVPAPVSELTGWLKDGGAA